MKFQDKYHDEPRVMRINLTKTNYLFIVEEAQRLSKFSKRKLDNSELINIIIAEFRTNDKMFNIYVR